MVSTNHIRAMWVDVCCRYCLTPPSIGAYYWEDDITKWPVTYSRHVLMF